MSTLSKEFRRQLETAVLKAREEAQDGAAEALGFYGVGDAKVPDHLDDAGKALRRKLRAHGRQVGDVRRADETQEVEHLVHECAYEHWHRILFARFLAENGFLIEPESGMDVDLDYCEERARAEKSDKWEVAAKFTQEILRNVFRADDPLLQLRLPVETRNRLTSLLESLPREVFLADDSLGWVYQFWQAKKKKQINEAEIPIGADELAPVTQLFTEDYMVEFLLHNTLGAWWAGKQKSEDGSQESEEQARKAVALPGVDWKYLRFVEKDGKWTPAAGTFAGWPKTVKELRVLDPCMGSGHFLVFALVILVRMRMEEESVSASEACKAVLRENLFGLELDPRCTQIAAFNLTLTAWKLGGFQKGLESNLACSGLGLHAKKEDWVKLAGENEKLQRGMDRLYSLFQKAPVLGSLINPLTLGSDLLVAEFHDLQPVLAKALQRETGDEAHELAVTAQGVAKAAEILASQFTLVATNVPYLGRNRQHDVLKDYCKRAHEGAKSDLAACFVERSLQFCFSGGSTALVTPQSWLFQDRYADLRKRLLVSVEWNCVIQLGARAFETITGERVNVSLLVQGESTPTPQFGVVGLNAASALTPDAKAELIRHGEMETVLQSDLLENPDARIVLEEMGEADLLLSLANSWQGIKTSDDERFTQMFWEQPSQGRGWWHYQRVSATTEHYAGREEIIFWEDGYGQLTQVCQEGASFRGKSVWEKRGIAVSMMGDLPATLYTGEKFSADVSIIEPKDVSQLPAAWAFCSSPEYAIEVRKIDRALRVTNSAMAKIPFDLARWTEVAAEKYPNGLPNPFSSNPTQWLFSGHPKDSDHPLQVAVVRLVGYRWPRQTGSSFPDCPALRPDGLEKHADNDGVVCFGQSRDEAPAAQRLRALLADAYGSEWGHALERKLIADTGSKAESLEAWLLNDFFTQHCEIFHNRPFVWHIWDGLPEGFNALVNYHKLAGPNGEGHRTLETLIYAYLDRDWIERQRDAVKQEKPGAEDRLVAAQELKQQLEKILAGEPPYDLFIRWKPVHRQPIGWEPDFNDGVRLNIRPFMFATLSQGKKGCGLFRSKPGSSLKWDKDRGKEPKRSKDDFPWFWKWDEQTVNFKGNGEFDGGRWNGCHYTTAFKRAAREGVSGTGQQK
jgi:hypothetical protein